jgi:predicted nucleic acid-binding protein
VRIVVELRYGALASDWANERRHRLEQSIGATTVVPVSDALLTAAAELRHACRQAGHPCTNRSMPTTYGSLPRRST